MSDDDLKSRLRETRRCEVCGGTATIRESSFLDPPGAERWYCAIHADPMHPERVSQPPPRRGVEQVRRDDDADASDCRAADR